MEPGSEVNGNGEEEEDTVHDLNTESLPQGTYMDEGAANPFNDYDDMARQRGGLKPGKRNSAFVGSGARNTEIADNLERQFNAIDTDMRESSMPGSGGYDADELSNMGGGLIGRASTTFVVDMAASH